MTNCSQCGLANLHPDGRLRCEQNVSVGNLLGRIVQPNDNACNDRVEGPIEICHIKVNNMQKYPKIRKPRKAR